MIVDKNDFNYVFMCIMSKRIKDLSLILNSDRINLLITYYFGLISKPTLDRVSKMDYNKELPHKSFNDNQVKNTNYTEIRPS